MSLPRNTCFTLLVAAATAGTLSFAGGLRAADIAEPADLVVTDARVVTLDATSTVAQALAVRQGRIIAVGGNQDIEKHVGAGTRRIDAAGRTLIPGLVDSHVHGIRAGVSFSQEVDWTTARSIPEALQRLRDRAAAVGPGQWVVVGPGWAEQQFTERRLPTREEIDAALPDNPGWIQLRYIALLVSTKGRERLDIDDARLPSGFGIQRDSTGQPTGWWSASMSSLPGLYGRLPVPTHAQSLQGTRQFFSELNRYGITGFVDHGAGDVSQYAALHQLWREQGLSVRVAYHLGSPGKGDELAYYKQALQALPHRKGDAWLRFNGIGESVTSAMNNNNAPDAQVQAQFYDTIRWAAEQGLSVSVHWIDSASVGVLLDLFDRVDREVTPIAPLRWSVSHLDNASPEALARMARLGVGWSTQLTTYYRGDDQIAQRGEAIRRQPPFVSGHAAGVKIGIGTDGHRAATYNPFVDLQWVLDGISVRGTRLRAAEEIPSREQALRMYTLDAAWFGFGEQDRGSLEVGKLADFAILDRDFFSVPVEQISATTSVLTVVDGKVVHAAEPFNVAGR